MYSEHRLRERALDDKSVCARGHCFCAAQPGNGCFEMSPATLACLQTMHSSLQLCRRCGTYKRDVARSPSDRWHAWGAMASVAPWLPLLLCLQCQRAVQLSLQVRSQRVQKHGNALLVLLRKRADRVLGRRCRCRLLRRANLNLKAPRWASLRARGACTVARMTCIAQQCSYQCRSRLLARPSPPLQASGSMPDGVADRRSFRRRRGRRSMLWWCKHAAPYLRKQGRQVMQATAQLESLAPACESFGAQHRTTTGHRCNQTAASQETRTT